MPVVIVITCDVPPPENVAERYSGKFVQLRWKGDEYLVFAPGMLHRYHPQILAHFCGEQGISCRWLSDTEFAVDDPDLGVIGGGSYSVDERNRVLALSGGSQIYGPFEPGGAMETLANAEHRWRGYEVRVR
jgi:hypothetical protein